MSSFNPDDLLNATSTQPMSTELPPVPEGDYLAMVSKLNIREPKTEGQSPILENYWKIDDPKNSAAHNRTVRQSIFLDMAPDGKTLKDGPSDNIGLGRVRKALGQNNKGQKWNIRMLEGGVARIHVKHRAGEPGTRWEGRIFDEVDNVVSSRQ